MGKNNQVALRFAADDDDRNEVEVYGQSRGRMDLDHLMDRNWNTPVVSSRNEVTGEVTTWSAGAIAAHNAGFIARREAGITTPYQVEATQRETVVESGEFSNGQLVRALA